MPSGSTPSHNIKSRPAQRIAAALRMAVAVLIVVALPAQAISASVERVWNAAHIHLDGAAAGTLPPGTHVAPAALPAAAGHFPMQRIQDIAQGRIRIEVESPGTAGASRLDTHAEAHRADTPHHHDNGAPGVVYVADDGGAPPAAPERTGKHDHDGFSPALAVTRTELPPRPRHALLAVAPTLRVSHSSGPGERPPR